MKFIGSLLKEKIFELSEWWWLSWETGKIAITHLGSPAAGKKKAHWQWYCLNCFPGMTNKNYCYALEVHSGYFSCSSMRTPSSLPSSKVLFVFQTNCVLHTNCMVHIYRYFLRLTCLKEGNAKFSPDMITSNFLHAFIIVRPVNQVKR